MSELKAISSRIAGHPGFAVFCTLAGVALTSFFGWLGAHQSAVISEKTTCIARVDSNEKNLREHSAQFMSSVGELVNYTIFPPSSKREDLAKAAGPVIKQGFAMSAYAPLGLSEIALRIAGNVQQASLASMGYADPSPALAAVKDSFGKWPSTYDRVMKIMIRKENSVAININLADWIASPIVIS